MVLRSMDRLLAELPYPVQVEKSEGPCADDEPLPRRIRGALATMAVALIAERRHPPGPGASTALDGAETVLLGELVTGREDRLPRIMPSLVFLVALPVVEQDRALALAQRIAELIAEAADADR